MRIYGFSKNLTKYGWKVYVLTIKERHNKTNDSERYSKDERIEIIKTNILPKLTIETLNAIKKFKKCFKKQYYKINSENQKVNQSNVSKRDTNRREKSKEKLIRIIDSFLLLPDENRNWIIPALFRALKIISRNGINTILTTCPPYSTHIIGLVLKLLFNVKWIVDYRDPWINPFNKYLYPTSRVSILLEKYLEKIIIKKADYVTTTTENLNNKFIEIYDKSFRNKFLHLSNGFDGEFFKNQKKKELSRFTITYTGTLYFGRTPEPIFRAICELKNENLISNGDIKLKLIGNTQYIGDAKTIDLVEKYKLKKEVEINEPVGYREAVKTIRNSNLGLVLAPKQPYQIPAKIYDMIGTETKVLAIADNGATKKLVEDLGIGECFHWSNIEGIKKFIYKEIRNVEKKNIEWKKIRFIYDQKEIARYLNLKISELY